MMKKRLFTLLVLLSAAVLPAAAQLSSAEYKERYDRQVRAVGYAGLGVETILERWGNVYPDDPDMLEGRFFFDFTRARSTKMLRTSKSGYMGREPLMALKDSTGAPVYFYEEEFYDDSLFNSALRFLDRAASLRPDEFLYRSHLLNAQIAREKEDPVLSVEELDALISYDKARHPAWTFRGQETAQDFFVGVVQDYCRLYFEIGSPKSYAALRRLSERMIKLYPARMEFQNNMGSYWRTAEKNPKKAAAIYKKVLSRDKDNYMAAKNGYLAARSTGDRKFQKTCLETLSRVSPQESERLSAEALLQSFK